MVITEPRDQREPSSGKRGLLCSSNKLFYKAHPPRPANPSSDRSFFSRSINLAAIVVTYNHTKINPPSANLVVLGLDVVAEVLGFLVTVVVVVVVVVVLGTDVLHLVDAATLGASLNGAVAGNL